MLVLARNRQEKIKINDDITITVVEIGHSRVKLGFEAPEDVVIHRQEIYDKIKSQEESKNGTEEKSS